MHIPNNMTQIGDTQIGDGSAPRTRTARSLQSGAVRLAVLMLLVAAGDAGLQAQSGLQSSLQTSISHSYFDLRPSLMNASDMASTSSSIAGDSSVDALTAERLSLSSDSTQPPPRRRYGRPRYNDKSHNADGSKKLTFELGAGFTNPAYGTGDYSKLNYKFQVGVGRNFNRNFGVLAQFDWDRFGIQTNTLNSLLATYNALGATGQNGGALTQIGGDTHIWSFSVNPIYNILQSEKKGAYIVAGVGFYHKATNITTPVVGTYCDYYYGCYQYPANASIDKYNSNAPGFNGGLGFTYRASRFSDAKFFAEARYVYISNSERPYFDGTKGTSLSPTYFNVFPQNSAKTSYIPVTFGIRF